MIIYVVTDSTKAYQTGPGWATHQRVLERISGDPCLVIHYRTLTPRLLEELRPWAICHSGGGSGETAVLQCKPYRDSVRGYQGAQIGFCAGHQIVAVFFGSRIATMRKLRPDEPDPANYNRGLFKEWGSYPVRLLKPDPLFRDLGSTIRVQEFHAWEITRLGKDLELIASTPTCRIQAYRHRRRPIYGTQFHPEQSTKACPDGFRLLDNFFDLAWKHWKGSVAGSPVFALRT